MSRLPDRTREGIWRRLYADADRLDWENLPRATSPISTTVGLTTGSAAS